MKTLMILLLTSYVIAKHEIKNEQRSSIDDLVKRIKDAIPEPIELEKIDLMVPKNISLISGSFNVTNFTASGLKAFTFERHPAFLPIPTSLVIGLKALSLDTKYAMDLPLLKIPLLSVFGDGAIRLVVPNIEIKIAFDFIGALSGKYIKTFNLATDDFGLSITGVFDDDGLSKQIADSIARTVKETSKKYSKDIFKVIRNVLNKVIHSVIHRNKTISITEAAEIS
ncbi:unnamed protein product [Acanthoscelides obtectus]|uniref:Uncharacterized protein n=1 Tax=Acanthoscelides obtectus TaxID=200917 RepID=A0A9P0VNY3_ACAOB|nr:unnamed protein product [Acanthoscelides obtectus]CAK1640577.1 hypothetical protein AOBTE_LOCUS11813 [Acanthoscelides obtectus]